MASFIFGGEGMPKTPQELARRRKIAEALAANVLSGNSAPQNVGQAIGQGLGDIGQAFAARRIGSRLDKAEKTGQDSANSAFSALLSGAGSPSAPSVPSETPQSQAVNDRVSQAFSGGAGDYANAIASIESAGSGGYSALGPETDSGDRAYGKYQVMGANVPEWTEAALGHRLTPQQFLASPEAQDAVFKHVFSGYVDKFGPEGAARAWFGGPGAVNAPDRKDMLGTSVGGYGDQFMANLGAIPKGPRMDATTTGSVSAAPALNAPRTVATPPAPPMQAGGAPTGAGRPGEIRRGADGRTYQYVETRGMAGASGDFGWIPTSQTAPGPDMQALAKQFGGSQQLANADPRKGILTALLSGRQNGKAGFPAAPGQGGAQSGNPTMQALMKAMSNPWLNEGQKAVVGALLKQEIAKSDPSNALDTEYKRAQIDKLHADAAKASNPLADQKYGLNPQYGVDANGNPVILQLGNNGVATQTALPDGVKLSKEPIKLDAGTEWILLDPITRQAVGSIPKNVGEAEAAKARGKAQGELSATLPTDMLSSAQTVQQIDQLLANPGLDSIVGPVDQYRPTWSLGDSGRDALARYNQLKGKSFLQAYATLKGGGQITEVEGKKAEDAMARMDRAQGETEFRTALKDFRDAVLTGQRKLLEKAGIPHDQWGRYLPQEAPQGNGAVKINGYTIQEVQ